MTKIIKITILDEVYCTVSGLEKEHQEFLFDKFSLFVEGYRFMPAFKRFKNIL
jgi:hypothetical protein